MLINHGIIFFSEILDLLCRKYSLQHTEVPGAQFFMPAQIIDIWVKNRDVLSGKGKYIFNARTVYLSFHPYIG